MPRHTGRTADYVVRLKGNVHIQTADSYQGLLWNYPLRPGRYVFLPGVRYRSDGVVTVNLALYWGWGHREPLVFGDFAARRQGGGGTVSPADAAGAVLSRWQAVFCLGSGNGNNDGATGAYAGRAIVSLLFAAAGRAACGVAVPAAGLFVGKAGTAAVGHGNAIWLRWSPRPDDSACPTPESGYTRDQSPAYRPPTISQRRQPAVSRQPAANSQQPAASPMN